MRLIILAAGDSSSLDGFNKLLLVHPVYKKPMIEVYAEYFEASDITLVTGYKSLEVMSRYPEYNYVYNSKWNSTGNAFSLGLALDDNPSIIVSSDLFMTREVIQRILQNTENMAVVKRTENKRKSGLFCDISDNIITNVMSAGEGHSDLELCGLFMMFKKEVLREWRRKCFLNPQKFAGEVLPLFEEITPLQVTTNDLYEINNTEEYIVRIR